VFLICLVYFHHSLPKLSNNYNDWGKNDYAKGQLRSAEYKYNRALKLDPNNEKAHYNLGILYEELQEPAPAIEEYRLAIKGVSMGHTTT
jgi:tetratricopeptide (TPR) repeat protein